MFSTSCTARTARVCIVFVDDVTDLRSAEREAWDIHPQRLVVLGTLIGRRQWAADKPITEQVVVSSSAESVPPPSISDPQLIFDW